MYAIDRCFLHGTRSYEQRISFFARECTERTCAYFPDVPRSFYENWIKDKSVAHVTTIKQSVWNKLTYDRLFKYVTHVYYPEQGLSIFIKDHFEYNE